MYSTFTYYQHMDAADLLIEDLEPLPRPQRNKTIGSRLENLTLRMDMVSWYTSGFM